MKRIAVDIDDTLYSFGNLAREMFVELALERGDKSLQRGAYCFWGEWRTPSDVVDPAFWFEVIDRCHSPSKIEQQIPFTDSIDTLSELVYQGYELLYISNRSPERAFHPTQDWLENWGFPAGELVCTMDPKGPHMSDCQYLIDDRPRTLVEFVYDFTWKLSHGSGNPSKRRMAFGLFGEYNRALTDIPNVYLAPNWALLRQYLIDKGVLDGDPR